MRHTRVPSPVHPIFTQVLVFVPFILLVRGQFLQWGKAPWGGPEERQSLPPRAAISIVKKLNAFTKVVAFTRDNFVKGHWGTCENMWLS